MKLGFIGCGNMASAIIKGIIANGIIDSNQIIASCKTEASREKAKANLGINMAENNKEVVEKAETIVLAVKPQFFEEVIAEIKDVVKDNQMVITLAPGKTLAWLEAQFGKPLGIGALAISNDDHAITLSGQQLSLLLPFRCCTAYCIKDFYVCTDLFCDFFALFPNSFVKSGLCHHDTGDSVPLRVGR